MTRIVAVHGVLPAHYYEQSDITTAFADMCLPPDRDRGVLERLHGTSRVRGRHLALPLERYASLGGFGQANDVFIETAQRLGEEAVTGALEQAGLSAADIDLVVFTSVTGIAAPSVEARLAGPLGLRPDVKRVPIFGLGCVAGAAGIARVHDYLVGHPDQVALLLSVELCSLTLQRTDASVQNLVAGALFGDGAAALLAVGRDRAHLGGGPPAPEVVATRSRLYPGTERLLGWDIGDSGFRIVLGADLPDLVRVHLGEEVRSFLADHDLKSQDVTAWVCHPGGPKVLDAVREALDLPARSLELTWDSLADVGNLSSASVLHILRDTLALRPPPPGTPGLLLAMGPGFSTELVLLRW
ncbi:type III polyketide synthase [Streptacidiphilus sp. PB12-B1b]|uniref:type III polyketide synthase n=1 Tax=Streptacidiphilus sp. PB12-B1b TaxID=2705012 RepID=UPI0015FA333D|nr:3-oxoacyl-[acyl-carrier-protein] synthase III C-terminal domain-containing protein [Streptacidiphilus sp. PB12-B1b]QMU77700.1 type III polyketide synthase [Streptacidiphilus sp. PB12-B1b]